MFNSYELSENQQLFVHDAENQGFEVNYNYSGRNMYGTKCPAITVDGMYDFQTRASVNYDNMGLGFVLYCRF